MSEMLMRSRIASNAISAFSSALILRLVFVIAARLPVDGNGPMGTFQRVVGMPEASPIAARKQRSRRCTNREAKNLSMALR
jgi:hypothetical protein